MDPKIWGPSAWRFLHSVALTYPEKPNNQDKINIKNFYYNVTDILPCVLCQQHYKNNLQKHKLTDQILSSKDLLNKWLVDVHNEVNIINNKKIYKYTNTQDLYNKLFNNNNKYYFALIILIIFAIIIKY